MKMSYFKENERSTPKYLWKNGKVVDWDSATVHVFCLNGIASSGIFEGIRAYWNEKKKQLYIKDVDSHITRLFNSAKLQRMTIPYSKEEVKQGIIDAIRKNGFKENIYIKPNVYVLAPFAEKKRTEIVLTPFPRPSHLGEDFTLKALFSSFRRISEDDMPPMAKAIGNYRQGRYVKPITIMGGWDEAFMLSSQGKVSECPGANLGFIKDGTLITPSLNQGVLKGVTRGIVLRIAKDIGLKIEERVVDRSELYLADEVFICGTGHGEVTPVVLVDDITIGDGKAGKYVTQIRNLYHDIVRGMKPKYMDLVTPVYKI